MERRDQCPIERIFLELRRVERQLDVHPAENQTPYIESGEWLVQARFALTQFLACPIRTGILPIMPSTRPIKLGAHYLRGRTRSLVSSAQVVNIRKHFKRTGVVRSFYVSTRRALAVKLLVDSATGNQSLVKESANRRMVESVGQLRVPVLLASDLQAAYPYVVDEFVDGRLALRKQDHRLLVQTLFPALRAHYAAYGISHQPCGACFGTDFFENVEAAAAHIAWPAAFADKKLFFSVVRRLLNSDRKLSCSFCHGDLNIDHIALMNDGRPCLLDWEAAAELPMACDLIGVERTCRRGGRLFSHCADFLRETAKGENSSEVYSPVEQMFLAALRLPNRWKYRRDKFEAEGRPELFRQRLLREFGYANELLPCL